MTALPPATTNYMSLYC